MFVWFCLFAGASAACLANAGQVMTGRPHKVPVNSTEVLRAAHFAVVEFNRANAEEQFDYKTVYITSAKIQVVAGMNYILEMLLGRTMCMRIYTNDGEPCVFHSELKCSMKGERNNGREHERRHAQRSQVGLQTRAS